MRILRGHGLDPNIWVAPRHGFDASTLAALREEGVLVLSDGFTRAPFLRSGLAWIPQQLWAPVEKERGLWTICVHPNTANDQEIAALRSFLAVHAAQFTSVDHVLFQFSACHLDPRRAHSGCMCAAASQNFPCRQTIVPRGVLPLQQIRIKQFPAVQHGLG